MTHHIKKWIFLSILVMVWIFLFGFSIASGQAETDLPGVVLTGAVFDRQGQAGR